MKTRKTYAANELVMFKTRREARACVIAAGKNTASVIDLGTDKAIGARWAVLTSVAYPVTVVAPMKTLVLGARRNREENMNTGRSNGNIHDVRVITKRSFMRAGV